MLNLRIIVKSFQKIVLFLALVIVLSACRGQPFEDPPVFVQPNMHYQEKFRYQQENEFFEDMRADRLPVEGTVSRGNLRIDHEYYEGVDEDGDFVTSIPTDVDRSFLMRGQERYDIYCTPCHGGSGDGQGIITEHGLVPPTFHDDEARDWEYGRIYSAIHNGYETMQSYRHLIPVEDRWAIVAYVRALQISQDADENAIQRLGLDLNEIEVADADDEM